ncbi:MAG: hypothetical protein JW809_09250 [Pirellulales bacterium]|nr:hypothetical protein [Pirellulales bacterium]
MGPDRSDLSTCRRRRSGPRWLLWGLVCLASLLSVTGCGGCRQDEKTEAEKEAERRAKEEEAKKPDFEFGNLVAQPLDQSSEKNRTVLCFYKPGHWTSTLLPAKANKEDFVGQLNVEVTRRSESGGATREPMPLPGVAYTMTQSRDVALPKGQPKLLSGYLFVPPSTKDEQASARLTLATRGGGNTRAEVPTLLTRMPAHQYHFVVLARGPNRYQYLKSLDSVCPPADAMINQLQRRHYQVSLLKAGSRLPLPTDALYWTSIAYVLWDDADPQSLSVDQRQALVDWLHWGGQLIVSGPDTLDTLRGDFLDDYLPATAAGVWELAAADFDELNARLARPGQPALKPTGHWTGVKLALARDAQFVPGTGKLLAERRVGRGRIVVSALRLSDRNLITWAGFDGLVNSCLLRRPPRKYHAGEFGDVELRWADEKADSHDAGRTCSLRYFSRDAGVARGQYTRGFVPEQAVAEPTATMAYPTGMGEPAPDLADDTSKTAGPGVAAWCDFGPVPSAAREALANAASVEVPGRWFVVWIVAAYLVVLVPLNWLVFTALGRVEWAWVAAPVIAVAYTVVVIHMAQLDIGFARSETNVGVLEIQSGYARAHLTRYTALYTSLTTYYRVEHEDPGAIAQPFSELEDPREFKPLSWQRYDTLTYHHGKESQLAGLLVASNSTDSVHTEQMVAMEGKLDLMKDSRGRWQLLNRTGLPLFGVGILHRADDGRIETAWVGSLGPFFSASLDFARAADQDGPWWPDQRDAEPQTAAEPTRGVCNIRKMMDLAENPAELRPGEFRLICWTDRHPPGVEARPAAPQSQSAVLVVAHLRFAPPPAPEPDANTKESFEKADRRVGPEDFLDEDALPNGPNPAVQ